MPTQFHFHFSTQKAIWRMDWSDASAIGHPRAGWSAKRTPPELTRQLCILGLLYIHNRAPYARWKRSCGMNSHNFHHVLTDHCLIDDLDLKIWPKKICISSHLNRHLIFCMIRILEKDSRSNNILAIPSTNRTLQNSSRAQAFCQMWQF